MKTSVIDVGHIRKDIPGFNELYQACSCGRIWATEKVRKSGKNYRTTRIYPAKYLNGSAGGTRNYLTVTLRKNQKSNYFTVHSLIMLAFYGTRPLNHEINHIDGNIMNNNPDNLEYVTKHTNITHAVKLGLNDIKGEKNPKAKLNKEQVLQILSSNNSKQQLSKLYGVHIDTINDILNRRTWAHV